MIPKTVQTISVDEHGDVFLGEPGFALLLAQMADSREIPYCGNTDMMRFYGRLFARAPDLLRALAELVTFCESHRWLGLNTYEVESLLNARLLVQEMKGKS